MIGRCWRHRDFLEVQTTNDGIEEEQTTVLSAKRRRHLVRAALDFPEELLNDIIGADRLPVLLGKGIKGQTRFQWVIVNKYLK